MKHGVAYSRVRTWLRLYRAHGTQGLVKKSSSYSAQFKLFVLRRMWGKKLSFQETAAMFNVRGTCCVARWERLYREGGYRALKRQRGRPRAMKDPKGKPSPRQSDTGRSQKDLIAELQQLRMENAYLKKLDALVRARPAPKERK
jgi:transposase